MIKFFGDNGNKGIVGIGLSKANLEKLQEGKPIKTELPSTDGPEFYEHELIIFYGETEESMVNDLRKAGIKIEESHCNHKIFKENE